MCLLKLSFLRVLSYFYFNLAKLVKISINTGDADYKGYFNDIWVLSIFSIAFTDENISSLCDEIIPIWNQVQDKISVML